MYPWLLLWNLLCSSGWPLTDRLFASVSSVLRFQRHDISSEKATKSVMRASSSEAQSILNKYCHKGDLELSI